MSCEAQTHFSNLVLNGRKCINLLLVIAFSVCSLMASDAFGNELNPPASSAEPGKIFEAASKAGLSGEGVLDPNGDGWITSTAAIFSTYPTISDESEEFEESGWVQIFHVSSEPIDDLDTGGACGATEVVDNNHTGQHAGYYRLIDQDSDPSNRNEYLQFRLRMAKEASGAFGYSILIDTDQTFGSSGAASDLNASSGNPGFELEILYGSGGGSAGVTMQDVDGATSGNSTLSFSSPGERDQKSYARFSNCTSDDPIFVDFYVSIGDMPAGITAQTPLRMVFASSSSPNTALGGSASDIGGVDDDQYPADDDAFTIVVESTPLLSFSGGYAAASGTSSIDFGNHVHYFPPLCQDPDSNAVEFQMFYVSTAETEAFDVLIYQGTSGSPVATLSDVSKGNPGTYDPGVFNNGASLVPAEDVGIVLSDAGLRFESAGGEDFYVTYRTRNSLQSGSLTCKGTSALGTEFRWGGIANKAVKENKLSNSAGFMATVDGTVVTVSGYDSDCEFRSGIDPDGIISDTVTFTLDAFETYVLEAIPDEAPANNAGWMGAKIESSEPIAVSTGGLNVGVISGASSRDVGIDQIVPTSRIGTDYVFIRGEGIDDTEFPIIVGVEDGTKVYVGGNLYGTLNDGDYFEIDPSNWSGSTVGSNMFVATDKPAYAFQCLAGYTQNNTIGMNFVTPLTCVPVGGIDEIPLVTDIAGANTYSSAITIISSSSLTSSDLIVSDGGGVVTLPPPTSVAGTTDWVSYFISGLSGNVSALAPAGQISVGIFMSYKHTSGGAVNAGMAGYYSLFNGVSSSYYTDSDGDGVGEGAGLGVYCEGNEPSGSVLNAGPDGCTDTAACNYDDPTGAACSYTQTTFYRDADNDGYGDSSDSQDACSAPTGYVADNTDCDDSDNAANPGISGSCGDNTPPTITSGTTGTDLAENSGAGQTVYTITATDDVAVTSYAIAGTDASLLSVDSSTGVVTLTADPDYEAKSSYSFTVTASDAASNTSTATTVTFSITNVDDAIPTITSGTTGTDLAENSGSGQTVYTIAADANDGGTIQSYAIAGTDVALLSVNSSTGVVTLTADPDYEAKSSYSFTVTATDESGTSTATTVTFSIAVVVVNTLVGCDGGDDLVIDLDTMHTATGVWTYNIDSNLSGFASGSIDGSELTIDFSGAGTDSARIDISGTSGTDSGTFEFLVIESGYPYYTDFQSVGVINPADSIGGNQFTFENGYDVPLTVHYYDNVVWAGLPLGGLSFAPYGDQQEALTDSTGHFVRMPSKDFWIYGYTNTYGCFNPEPATSGTPSASPTLRPVVIPYIIENED